MKTTTNTLRIEQLDNPAALAACSALRGGQLCGHTRGEDWRRWPCGKWSPRTTSTPRPR